MALAHEAGRRTNAKRRMLWEIKARRIKTKSETEDKKTGTNGEKQSGKAAGKSP